MRFLLALLLPALLTTPAFAKSKAKPGKAAQALSKFSGDLLSYNQLMRLPKAKRMQYLKQTVDLLATMESFNNQYSTAELDQLRKLREQFAYFLRQMSFLPEASAADQFEDTPPPVDVSLIVPTHNGFEWTCGRGAAFDYTMRACMVLNASGHTNFTQSVYVDGMTEGAEPCPRGTVEVPHYKANQAACIPNANWARIPEERKSGIKKSGFLPPSYLRGQSLEQQRRLILGGERDPDMAPVLPAPQSAAPGVVAGDDQAPGRPAVGTSQPAGVAVGTSEPAVAAPGVGVSAPAQGNVAVGTSVAPDACRPATVQCQPLKGAALAAARTRWAAVADYQGVNANVCIRGGFLSTYKTAKKDPGSCQPVRSISLGSGRTTPPCPSGEELCNPALFCIGGKNAQNKFEPVTICVKPGGDADKNLPVTDACAAKYAKILEGKTPLLTCKVDPKLKGNAKKKAEQKCAAARAVKGQACDPGYLPEDTNFKRAWEELVAQTKKLRDVWCGNSDFAALFCRECEIVNDKIYAMNQGATGTGCAEASAAGVPAAPPQQPQDAGAVREEPRDDGR